MNKSVAVITAAMILSASYISQTFAAVRDSDICGKWVLDSERNSDIIDELYLQYGSSLRHYGAELFVGDGKLSYYIGLSGGEGTYTRADGVITADIVSYNGGRESTERFYEMTENGEIYLLYRAGTEPENLDIIWRKSD